jgi:hypothetical protein
MDRCNRYWNMWQSPTSSACNNGGCDTYHNDDVWHCHDPKTGECVEGHEEHCVECHDSCDCRRGEE